MQGAKRIIFYKINTNNTKCLSYVWQKINSCLSIRKTDHTSKCFSLIYYFILFPCINKLSLPLSNNYRFMSFYHHHILVLFFNNHRKKSCLYFVAPSSLSIYMNNSFMCANILSTKYFYHIYCS